MTENSFIDRVGVKGAKLISFAFTPFLVPFLAFCTLLFFTRLNATFSRGEIFRILDIVFRFTIVLPLISIFLLHKLNHFSISRQITFYQQTVGSFMVSTLCYSFIFIVLAEMGFSYLYATIVSAISVLVLFLTLTYRWRKGIKVRGVRDEYDLIALSILNRRQDRFMPLLVTLISYIFCALMMLKKHLPWYLNAIIFASILILCIHLLINAKLRVSEHMAAMGALTGGFISLTKLFEYDPLIGISISIFIAGLLGTSRMLLKHNNAWEILLGYLIGVACSLIALNNTCYHYISSIFTYKFL